MANELDAVTEAMLATLVPRAAAADPVAAAYAAGRAAGRRGVAAWRAVAAGVAAVGAAVAIRPAGPGPAGPAPAVTIGTLRPTRSAVFDPTPLQSAEVVRVQQALLERGLDGLPPPPRRAVFPPVAPGPVF